MGFLIFVILYCVIAIGYGEYTCNVSSNYVETSDAGILAGFNDALGTYAILDYYDTALKESATLLYPGVLRHPGGTTGNYWSFKNASFVTPCNTSYYNYCIQQQRIETYPPQTFSSYNFSNGVSSYSTINQNEIDNVHGIVYDMNVFTLNGTEMLNQLDYLKYNPSKTTQVYYELGNELYITIWYKNLIPNSTYYMNKVIPLINKIKKDIDNPKIAVLTKWNRSYSDPWNIGIAKYNYSFDAVTIHDYTLYNTSVVNFTQDEQVGYIMGYGQSVIPQYIEYVKDMYGENKKVCI